MVPEVHVIVAFTWIVICSVVEVVLLPLIFLPLDISLVPLLDLFGIVLVVEMIVLFHSIIHVHKAFVVDEQLELFSMLREPQPMGPDHELILE